MISSAEAGCELYIDPSIPGVEGQQVFVAVRPEKMAIHKEPRPAGRNCVHGVVDEIAYLGNFSTYVVRLDSGKIVRVVTPNLYRMVDLPITWEDEVWLTLAAVGRRGAVFVSGDLPGGRNEPAGPRRGRRPRLGGRPGAAARRAPAPGAPPSDRAAGPPLRPAPRDGRCPISGCCCSSCCRSGSF